jgi:hypothetical protein
MTPVSEPFIALADKVTLLIKGNCFVCGTAKYGSYLFTGSDASKATSPSGEAPGKGNASLEESVYENVANRAPAASAITWGAKKQVRKNPPNSLGVKLSCREMRYVMHRLEHGESPVSERLRERFLSAIEREVVGI